MSLGDLFTRREHRWFAPELIATMVRGGCHAQELVSLFTCTRFVFHDVLGQDWGSEVLRHRPDMRFALRACASGYKAFDHERGRVQVQALTTNGGIRFVYTEWAQELQPDARWPSRSASAAEMASLCHPGQFSKTAILAAFGLADTPASTRMLVRIGEALMRPGGTISFSYCPSGATKVVFYIGWTNVIQLNCCYVNESGLLPLQDQTAVIDQFRTLGDRLISTRFDPCLPILIKPGTRLFAWLLSRRSDPTAKWTLPFE